MQKHPAFLHYSTLSEGSTFLNAINGQAMLINKGILYSKS